MGLGGLAFELSDVANILKLGLGFANILTRLTTKSSEDVTAFFLSTNLDEPSRRFRKEPADGEEPNQWSDLESNGESPGKFPSSSLVETAATEKAVSYLFTVQKLDVYTHYSIQ